jgi:hypothetical protein
MAHWLIRSPDLLPAISPEKRRDSAVPGARSGLGAAWPALRLAFERPEKLQEGRGLASQAAVIALDPGHATLRLGEVLLGDSTLHRGRPRSTMRTSFTHRGVIGKTPIFLI